jgi:hypothetical protein
VAFAQHPSVAQRAVQPAPQQASAHRTDGGVQHAQQRVAGVAIDAGIQFQVAARGRVHGDGLARGFHRDRSQVRQTLLLGFLDIAEQGASRGGRQWLVVDAEPGQVVQAEELQQLAAAAVGVEQPGRAPAHAGAFRQEGRQAVLIGNQQLGRLQTRELSFQRVGAIDFID